MKKFVAGLLILLCGIFHYGLSEQRMLAGKDDDLPAIKKLQPLKEGDNIMFWRLQKVGSSTILSILMSYAYRYNFLPRRKSTGNSHCRRIAQCAIDKANITMALPESTINNLKQYVKLKTPGSKSSTPLSSMSRQSELMTYTIPFKISLSHELCNLGKNIVKNNLPCSFTPIVKADSAGANTSRVVSPIKELFMVRHPLSRAVSVYYFWGELFKLSQATKAASSLSRKSTGRQGSETDVVDQQILASMGLSSGSSRQGRLRSGAMSSGIDEQQDSINGQIGTVNVPVKFVNSKRNKASTGTTSSSSGGGGGNNNNLRMRAANLIANALTSKNPKATNLLMNTLMQAQQQQDVLSDPLTMANSNSNAVEGSAKSSRKRGSRRKQPRNGIEDAEDPSTGRRLEEAAEEELHVEVVEEIRRLLGDVDAVEEAIGRRLVADSAFDEDEVVEEVHRLLAEVEAIQTSGKRSGRKRSILGGTGSNASVDGNLFKYHGTESTVPPVEYAMDFARGLPYNAGMPGPSFSWSAFATNLKDALTIIQTDRMATIVLERLDESLVMVRHFLGWSLADLIVTKQRKALSSHPKYTEWPAKALEAMNKKFSGNGEWELYNTSIAVLDANLQKLRDKGVKVEKEVELLQALQKKVTAVCLDDKYLEHYRRDIASKGFPRHPSENKLRDVEEKYSTNGHVFSFNREILCSFDVCGSCEAHAILHSLEKSGKLKYDAGSKVLIQDVSVDAVESAPKLSEMNVEELKDIVNFKKCPKSFHSDE